MRNNNWINKYENSELLGINKFAVMGRQSKKRQLALAIAKICNEKKITSKYLAGQTNLETRLIDQIRSGIAEDVETGVLEKILACANAIHQ